MLYALAPADAAANVMPPSMISSNAGFTQAVYDDILASAQARRIVGFSMSCTGSSGSPGAATLVSTGAGVGLSIAGKLVPALATGPGAALVLGGEALVGLFTAIFSHHAQAVQREQQTECATVPSANDTLAAIQSGVQQGTISPAQGIAALQQLLSEFAQTAAPIIKADATHCNAMCVWQKCLEAAVIEMTSDFQDLQNSAASSGSTATAGSSQPNTSPSPSWLPIALIGFGIFALTEVL